MKVNVEVSPEKIANTMVSAIEGNHMTRAWCAGVYKKSRNKLPKGTVWYAQDSMYKGRFCIDIVEIIDENKEPTGKNLRHHLCDQDAFAKGLTIMAQKMPKHFGDLLAEGGDIITADVFLQCVALGEVIYG